MNFITLAEYQCGDRFTDFLVLRHLCSGTTSFLYINHSNMSRWGSRNRTLHETPTIDCSTSHRKIKNMYRHGDHYMESTWREHLLALSLRDDGPGSHTGIWDVLSYANGFDSWPNYKGWCILIHLRWIVLQHFDSCKRPTRQLITHIDLRNVQFHKK